MQKSLWEETCTLPTFKKLEKDIETDVLIIGGGMTGILCAKFLSDKNIDYVLCEAKTIGSGTSAKTTAVLSAQHDILYGTLIKKFGLNYARQYLNANLKAIETFRKMANNIDCDFEICPSYQFSSKRDRQLESEVQALSRLGFHAKLTKHIPLPVESKTNLCFPTQAQFHPLKFIGAVAKDLNIYENTRIDKCDGTTAFSGDNKIFAKRIIVASHFPIINSKGLYFTKLYQKHSYVLALENTKKFHGTFVDKENGFYFRTYKNLLLVGGGDHRTGYTKDGFKIMRDYTNEHFPKAKIKYSWSTQDCMSLDGVPYIGRYSKSTPDIYVATGFNEWGMTSSAVAAEILCDMLCGKSNPFESVFSPQRSMFAPQLFANLGTTLFDFATPTLKRCSHLGCALKWNKYEHTWDCPCHGSRFKENGEIINNPATKELKPKMRDGN